jgi:hypothetical protein
LEAADFETYAELAAADQTKAMEFLKSKNENIPQFLLEAMQEFGKTFLS